tara:strand:- start:9889 stop:10152 length:264 start_codon:yes stop_codon:yes gene_type:complete
MATIKNEKAIKEELTKLAKQLDWDDLAWEIIVLEAAVVAEEDDNYLKLLEIKLEIWEEEKKDRVSDRFSMEKFLNKGYSFVDSDTFG